MGKIQHLLIALLVVAGVGIVPQAVDASEDEWADDCRDVTTIDPNSEYEGSIDTPDDSDCLLFQMNKGESLNVSVIIPNIRNSFRIEVGDFNSRIDSTVPVSVTNINGVEYGYGRSELVYVTGSEQASFRLFAEEDGLVRLDLQEHGTGAESEIPYEWQLSVSKDNPEPAGFEVTELRDRVSELESQLQQKNQRISELESLLEQKNQTISELESQSSDGSGGDVTIQVTVTPANGQQNFVEGGEAVVQAESENADVSEMSVEYGSGTYQLDSSGQVAIPLAQTGTQEMTLVYGDITKQVSFEVQAQEGQNQQNQQNQQDTTSTGTSGPGFGIVVALIAIFGSAFLLQRYR